MKVLQPIQVLTLGSWAEAQDLAALPVPCARQRFELLVKAEHRA
jgi:hypothetical protein